MGDIQQKTEPDFAFASDLSKSRINPFRYDTLRLPVRRAQRQRVMAKTRQGKPSTVSLREASKEPAGAQPTFFLRTKLLPPRPAPELLSRPRLAEQTNYKS